MLKEITTPTIPHSVEYEQAVLGSLMIDPSSLPMVRGIINRDDDMYIVRHKWIWQTLCELDEKKHPIDLLTVSEELSRKGRLEELGGSAYITGLIADSPSSLNVEHYARTVHLLGVRRRMIQAAGNVTQYAYDEALDVEDVVSRCIEEVQTAANGLLGGRAQGIASLISDYYDLVGERSQQTVLPGTPTGFFDLDILLGGGLQDGELTLVGGFPGMGKTAFLDTVAFHVSRTKPVALFTLEMSSMERTNRIIAQQTGIDSQRLRAGKLKENEWPIFTNSIEEIEKHKLIVDDTAPLSMATLRAKVVQWRSQGKADVVIVDYAGLVDGIGKSKYEIACNVSRGLKLLTQETGCHILAAVQLNREGRQHETPKLYHFRDSGSWEQDCNNAFLIYEVDKLTSQEYSPRRLEIAKHRNGPVGFTDLLMKKATTKFSSEARHD